MNPGPMRVPRYPRVILSTSSATATSSLYSDSVGFEHTVWQLVGTFTGYSVMVYGTLDPTSVNSDGSPNSAYPLPGVGGSWFPVPGPTEGTESTVVVNPLTTNAQVLETKIPLVAYAVVATGTSQTGTLKVVAWAID